MPTSPIYPLSAVRALALHAQGLDTPNGTEPTPTLDRLYSLVERLGCLQIDTLQMVHRSHYVIPWSRLGRYDPADLDRLLYDQEHRRCFEYWLHGACVLPLSDYRYRLPTMRRLREPAGAGWSQWLSRPENIQLVAAVHERIRNEGALRAADFEYDGPKRGSWWDWKPAKAALELLFDRGDLMVADRVNFQRVYDLRQRVLPAWVDTTEPGRAEAICYALARDLKALGVCALDQLPFYSHHVRRAGVRAQAADLLPGGLFVEITARLAEGEPRPLVVHRDSLPLLQQAADGALPARRTTFLNPFDPLFYAPGRDRQFWAFHQTLEAYRPAPQRRWGYFCLPILHQDRLVGRFDPKLERKSGTLRLKALYLEPGVAPDSELVAAVATAMRDFLAFHQATDLIVERSDPAEFGPLLLAAL